MPIQMSCPHCQKQVRVPDEALGKKVRCQGCSNVFVTELPPNEPAPAPAPPEVKTASSEKSAAETAAAAPTGIKEEGKVIPPMPSTKTALPPPLPESNSERLTSRPSAKTSARKASPGNGKVLVALGLGAFVLLSLACVGVGLGGWWYFSAPADQQIAQNDPNNKNPDGKGKDGKKAEGEGEDNNPVDAPVVVPVEIKAPVLDQDRVVRDLPGNIDQLAIGGGGRFILLGMPQTRKIAMFDANEAKVVHYFTVSGDNVRFAASMDKLVMVFPDTKIVQRWSLISKEREVTTTLPDVQNISHVAMGSASNGPLVVAGGGFVGGHAFIDLKTLKKLAIQQDGFGGGRGFGEGGLRVSADGTVFGCWGGGSPTGLQTYVLTGNRLKSYYEHTTVGHIAPGPDGRYVYTGSGVYTSEVKPVGTNINRNGNGKYTLPALHGNYYLSIIHGGDRFDPNNKNQPFTVAVHQAGEERSLINLTNIEMADVGDRWAADSIGRDKRYMLIPDAKMLVVLPQTNNRIVVHRFDVEEALDKAGIDYLFVISRPRTAAQQGKTYSYQLKVKSKQGGVKFKLDAGPEGMKIAPDGKLTWKIPNEGANGEHNVIVTVSDKTGQEIFHTFKIAVGEQVVRNDPQIIDRKDVNDPPFIDIEEKGFFPKKDLFEPMKDPPFVVKADLPPLPARLPIQPPKLEQDQVTRQLPDTISDIAIGGGGRFLICLLPKMRQLAIFDANEGKVVKFIPIAGDNARIAAGMTKLFVAFPDTKIMQRWNLLTFERELSTTLPLADKLAGIGMGYGSDGPLFVQTTRGIVSGEQLFFDIKTMKRLDVARNQQGGHIHIGDNARVRGSADGSVLGVTADQNPGHIVVLDNGGAFTARSLDNAGHVPGADGKIVFGNGLFNHQGQNVGKHNQMHCVPALQGNFYLGIPTGTFHPQVPNDKTKFGNVTLFITGDTRPLVTLPGVEKATRDVFAFTREPLRIDQRYHFIPDAQLLVTIPSTADKLIVQKLDVDDALDKASIDYLFVNSSPFPYAVKGEDYQYQLQVKSKKGVKKHNVDAGPAGMKTSANGLVTWKVPKDFADSSVDIIMSISDKADQEVFHTFKLTVVDELPSGVVENRKEGKGQGEEKK